MASSPHRAPSARFSTPRVVSFVVLVAIFLLIAGLFLRVMAGFLLPLFLALLLVVMFGPLHHWFRIRCRGHDRTAAGLTTLSILLMVLVPLSLLLIEAGCEAQVVYRAVLARSTSEEKAAGEKPAVADPAKDLTELAHWAVAQAVAFGDRFGMTIDAKEMETSIHNGIRDFLGPLAFRTTQYLGGILISLAVMLLATYYFFADGRTMIEALLRLSPLEGGRTQELIDHFDDVTRAVVVATLASAFVQGLLAGVGFYMAGVSSVFLLTALSMLLTLVPFIGAAIVWVPVCLWLFAVEGHTASAVILAAYCIGVVSMVDNLVKPLVLHGRSNLHPLLALLSVLGGTQALGPIGILVGPMVVAFLQTLLNMVHAELNNMAGAGEPPIRAESRL